MKYIKIGQTTLTVSETIPEGFGEVNVTDSSDVEDVCILVESDEVVTFSVKKHNDTQLIATNGSYNIIDV